MVLRPAPRRLSVSGMTIKELLDALAARGLDVVRYVFDHGGDGLGFAGARQRRYQSMGAEFFGPCREKAVRASALAEAQEFSLDRLEVLYKFGQQLRNDAPITRWQLRLELARLHHLDIDTLAEHAKARVRELNAATGKKAPRSLIVGRHADATGRRTAVLKLPEEEMAQLESRLRARIRGRGQVAEDVAMGNAAWAMLVADQGREPVVRELEPTVLVTADDMDGVGENMLQATDGTRVHADEYLRKRLHGYGWVLLYDRNAQPVNLYRLQRHANAKQRAIIAADQGQCGWPGCQRVALYGTAHHIKAWSQDGETNLDNLVGLCGPHNAMNDDDPDRPPRNGRMDRDPSTGQVKWFPPDGGPPRTNQGHHTAHSGRAWAVKKLSAS